MRNYKKIQTEKNTVTKIVCNKCKKECRKHFGTIILMLHIHLNPPDYLPLL